MNDGLFHIVYCSRNLIRGEREFVSRELQNILTKSRTNNAPTGITGALLYSAESFAQVLEGSLPAIERVFETIQRDSRHGDVTVVRIGPIGERQFPEWSMAFAGRSTLESSPETIAAFDAVFSNAPGGAEQILNVMKDMVVSEKDCTLLDAA